MIAIDFFSSKTFCNESRAPPKVLIFWGKILLFSLTKEIGKFLENLFKKNVNSTNFGK
jgi:hypothetical protein